MRRIIPLLFVVLLVVITPSSSKAQLEVDKKSLQGLTGIWVLVERVDKDVEENGLTQSQLRTDTELKLRTAGIHVATGTEGLSNPNLGTLHISVMAKQIKTVDGLYLASITVELLQDARLLRNPSIKVFGVVTYEVSDSCGAVSVDHLRDDVRRAVSDKVDVFINDYLAVNPKDKSTD